MDVSKNQADKNYATYWWNIHFDQTQKVEFMRGYSKFIGQEERRNKLDLLITKVQMFSTHNYLNRITRIEIFKRVDKIIQMDKDQMILVLYPTSYEWKDILSEEANHCNKTIRDIYAIRAGNTSIKLPNLNFKRSEIKREDIIDPHKRNKYFKTLQDLTTECQRMLSSGYAQGQVVQFYQSCLELNPRLI